MRTVSVLLLAVLVTLGACTGAQDSEQNLAVRCSANINPYSCWFDKCAWDSVGGSCLSPTFSACSDARTQLSCQVLTCNWDAPSTKCVDDPDFKCSNIATFGECALHGCYWGHDSVTGPTKCLSYSWLSENIAAELRLRCRRDCDAQFVMPENPAGSDWLKCQDCCDDPNNQVCN